MGVVERSQHASGEDLPPHAQAKCDEPELRINFTEPCMYAFSGTTQYPTGISRRVHVYKVQL